MRRLRHDDIESRCRCFGAAFPSEQLTIDAYRSLRQCSLYEPQLDIVAVSPIGDVAAFATLWLDRSNRVAQIEPAGCDPRHRQRGLTSASIMLALETARSLGAESAIVRHHERNDAARRLYESCGFAVASDLAGFSKSFDEQSG